LEENLAQKPISAWDPTGRAWLKQLRDSVQEVLRQIARQQAYAQAYGWSGHGAIGIGMANFQMGQLQMAVSGLNKGLESANPKTTVQRSFYDKGFYGPYVGHVKVYSYPWVDMKGVIKVGDTPLHGAVVSESREIVYKQDVYQPFKLQPLRTPRTDSKGAVLDRFSAPFVSGNGYVTFRQTLTLPSGVSTPGWHFTLHANGTYEIDKEIDSFR
ncbi:hypothetical protein IRY61_06560, partial [Candidatus Saccharibacteria bacterium]|nr:hypothetical protein [Candidatus Saccharibacteria bacterium]